MDTLKLPPLLRRLESSRSILIAGAGGGFDIFAGLPLALSLMGDGKTIHFANLSFTYLGGTTAQLLAPHLYAVEPSSEGEPWYFPERVLSRWLDAHGHSSTVFAFEKVGVRPLRAAYEVLQERLGFDAVVLVDGGTDILMRGDEEGLGTPQEDMTSLAAVHKLAVPRRLVICLGFGVDAYHGVCHAHFLENVARIDRAGGYLGALSIPRDSPEAIGFLQAVGYAQAATPDRPSIVNGSIAAAIQGQFGNVQFTDRTSGSELFINPLMGIYFAFDLPTVAQESLYLDQLEDTDTIFQVSAIIKSFRKSVQIRPRRPIPV